MFIKNPYIRLVRPYQIVKNVFIFIPLFFGGKLLDMAAFQVTFWAFLGFSAITASVYILNDYLDQEKDKKHPKKCNRPFAAGQVSLPICTLLFIGLITTGVLISYFNSPVSTVWVFIYFGINIGYSTYLKQIPILDSVIIAMGFMIRLYLGASVASIPLSKWIVVMTFLLAMLLAFGKRRSDLLLHTPEIRQSIRGYSEGFINASITVFSSAIVVAYLMYCIESDSFHSQFSDYLYVTALFVILGILRYLQRYFVFEDTGDPTKLLLKDGFLATTLILWITSFLAIIYI